MVDQVIEVRGRALIDHGLDALEKAGHPVVKITLDEETDLGQEFFRWEIATAVAGSILGINPFNQPDVEASKVATQKLTKAYEDTGKLTEAKPLIHEGDVSLFADPKYAATLQGTTAAKSAKGYLAAHLGQLRKGDYFAINAYV